MNSSNKRYLFSVLFILLFKLFIIYFLPLMGDEAYFIKWAHNLSSGYYDHPPMAGWLIYLLSFINSSYIFFRFFVFVSIIIVSFFIYNISILLKASKEKAFMVSLLFLVSPIDILMVLFTNDIPLLLFGTISSWLLIKSFNTKNWFYYSALTGIFLGLAFLSKYFAIFLAIGLLIWSIISYRTKAIKNIVVVVLFFSIFLFQNLYFNYNSCWNNIMFNLFSRANSDIGFDPKTLFGYFGLIIYLVTPWGLYYILKTKQYLGMIEKFIYSIIMVVLLIFFMVSLKNKIGLHWFILFLPYIYMLFLSLESTKIKDLFRYNLWFTTVHIVLILTIIFVPKNLFQNHKHYSNIVLFTSTNSICQKINKLRVHELFALDYTTASILSYHCQKDIKMLFNNSKYGRLDDKLLDARTLENKDIYYFSQKKIDQQGIKDNCVAITTKIISVKNAKFYVKKCKKFNYPNYKKRYLDIQKAKFYNIPSWLPTNRCYFIDRYYR